MRFYYLLIETPPMIKLVKVEHTKSFSFFIKKHEFFFKELYEYYHHLIIQSQTTVVQSASFPFLKNRETTAVAIRSAPLA